MAGKPKDVLRAAVYARTSREDTKRRRRRKVAEVADKLREKVSIAQQVEDGQRRAQDKGWVVAEKHIFADPDRSGKLPPKQWAEGKRCREGLTHLVAAIEAHEIDVLIIRKRDRLARNLLLQLKLYEFLLHHKVRLVCTKEELPEGGDASGRFVLVVLSAAAQLQLEQTSENIRDAKNYAKRNDMKLCGAVNCFGFTDGEGEKATIEIDEEQAAVVRSIYEKYRKGESASSLARWLNENHRALRSKHLSNKGLMWRTHTVTRILTNPHYAGYRYIFDDDGKKTKRVKASKLWPRIVQKEVYWDVQRHYESEKHTHSRRTIRLFSGLLTCGFCGNKLVAFHQYAQNEVVFKCPNKHECERHPFAMRTKYYDQWYSSCLAVPRDNRVVADTASIKTKLVKVEELKHQIRTYDDLLASGEWDLATYTRLRRLTNENIQKLDREVDAERRGLHARRETKPWSKMTLPERREDILSWVKDIKVFSKYLDVTGIDDGCARFPLMHYRLPNRPLPCNVLVHPERPAAPDMPEHKGHKLTVCWWKPGSLSRYFCYADKRLNPKFTSKVCPACCVEKPLSEFSRNKRASDGLTTYCKECNWRGLTKYRKLAAGTGKKGEGK